MLRQCDLMFVYLARGWITIGWEEQAWKIIKAWPAIVHSVSHTRKPTIFEVHAGSLKVERVKLVSQLIE